MNTLLKTLAACIFAATMVPVCADEPTVHIVIEPQKNENEVDSAAAWSYAIIRSLGVGGTLAAGLVTSAALASPIPFLFSVPCTWIWAYFLDNKMDKIAGMNQQTAYVADMINGRLCEAMLAVGVVAALGAAAQRSATMSLSK